MKRIFSRFLASRRGNVGITFGILILPLMLGVGAAIDYSKAAGLLANLQTATDATALILCQAPSTVPVADLRATAAASVQSYVSDAPTTIVDLQLVTSPRSVTLRTSSAYQTAFMKIVNQSSVPVGATSACAASESYFEIALVLDTTGSMASSGGTTSKLDAAKSAAKTFIDYMYTAGALPGHVRMSLVPFAASVAIPTSLRTASWLDTTGLSPLHWQYVTNPSAQSFTSRLSIFSKLATTTSSWDWAGCVEAPVYPYDVTDAAMSAGTPSSLIVPLFAPDEIGNTSFRLFNLFVQDGSPSVNSYIDDGNATGSLASCRSDDPTASKRFTQACKYISRSNARNTDTSNPVDGPNSACTSRPLSVLGTGQTTLKSEIDALSAVGSTNIHEGFMWGWRTISPTSNISTTTTAPVAYGTKNYTKVIVLMTDGVNQWLASSASAGSRYSAYGYFRNADGTDAAGTNSRFLPGRSTLQTSDDGRAAIDELLQKACTNAKAKNVVVYTIGFSTPTDPIDAQGLSALSNCSSGSQYTFVANDSAGLISAFDKIAKGIGSLRLTR